MTVVHQWKLRADFAKRLSTMYGREVPAYTTLVDVCHEVNTDVLTAGGDDAQRLGSIERVSAERHGAIRIGTRTEMAQLAAIFAGFGMFPVGFYDLREAATRAVPVVSTAFRPIDSEELARNPFRVFTSMLVASDRRFFDADLQSRLENFLDARQLFSPELLQLADRAAAHQGLEPDDAERFLAVATAAFELSREPVDRAWYEELQAVSAVAADIGGVASTHVNHLTPRVLDIDELYRRMAARGVDMIDAIQGPPRWDGPDLLLRQTSFRALAERRQFRERNGQTTSGDLRVRFGEVEARGIAVTPLGRRLYDELTAATERTVAESPAGARVAEDRNQIAADIWHDRMPRTETQLVTDDLAYFTFRLGESHDRSVTPPTKLANLVQQGWLRAEPIVYEDFLPKSAAGIFQSNLTSDGRRDDTQSVVDIDSGWMEAALGATLHDPDALYASLRARSLARVAQELDLRDIDTTPTREGQRT